MRLFTCSRYDHRLYFENVACERCNATLGFLPDQLQLVSLDAGSDGRHYDAEWAERAEKTLW